jgi:hypothetical protein
MQRKDQGQKPEKPGQHDPVQLPPRPSPNPNPDEKKIRDRIRTHRVLQQDVYYLTAPAYPQGTWL